MNENGGRQASGARYSPRRIRLTLGQSRLLAEEAERQDVSEAVVLRNILLVGFHRYFEGRDEEPGIEPRQPAGPATEGTGESEALLMAILAMLAWHSRPVSRALRYDVAQEDPYLQDGVERNAPLGFLAEYTPGESLKLWRRVGEEMAANGGDYIRAMYEATSKLDVDREEFSGATEEAWMRLLENTSPGILRG